GPRGAPIPPAGVGRLDSRQDGLRKDRSLRRLPRPPLYGPRTDERRRAVRPGRGSRRSQRARDADVVEVRVDEPALWRGQRWGPVRPPPAFAPREGEPDSPLYPPG